MSHSSPSGCVLSAVPWVRTDSGTMTPRQVLIDSHTIGGLDPALNGVQVGATLRLLTAVTALVIRKGGRPQGRFSPEAVDAAIESVAAHTNLYDADTPFLQVPAGSTPPKAGSGTAPKKLYPWMPADEAEAFWSRAEKEATLDAASAALALAVHYHYSFGGNSKLDGLKALNGSPGIRYPGVGYTATEVLWKGESLFDTLLMNTPKAWVEGEGLPAWADPGCTVSRGAAGRPEHPLWRATWGSNTAHCRWEDGNLTAVSIGGSKHLPPTMGAGKEAAKAWWDQRNTEDSFYLYADIEKKNAKGVVLSVERKAQRLDLGHSETDLAVEWNAKNLSSTIRARSAGTVKTPGRGAEVMFLRHQVEGTASSPVVRRTERLISSPKKWVVSEDRADAVSDAASRIKSVVLELGKPFTDNGRLKAIRDRRGDVTAAFWREVSKPFEDYIINGTGESIDPAVWPAVQRAALNAFDEVTSSTPVTKLGPFILTARSGVARNIATLLELTTKKSDRKDVHDAA